MSYTEQLPERIQRPAIDQLTVIEAVEQLAQFCLEAPDLEQENQTVRLILDGIYAVAVESSAGIGIGEPVEDWIKRVRVSPATNPFAAPAGLEVILPYGANASGTEEDPRIKFLNLFHAGVFASYPYDGGQWCGRELLVSTITPIDVPIDVNDGSLRGIDLHKDTVELVDAAIERDARGPSKNYTGFYLADIIQAI